MQLMKNLRNSLVYTSAMVVCTLFSSCFKDDPLNSEADITAAFIHTDNPKAVFYNLSDTAATITRDYASSEIVFDNALRYADITDIAPQFTLSPGATITPASGTPQDFSQGGHIYKVTSEDGKWTREYNVRFSKLNQVYKYDFENYKLSNSGNYYIWSDFAEGETPNWSSANEGFEIARSKASKEEYPTTPDGNGFEGACVKLTTCSTGPWGIISHKRIAAGNLFLGTFDLSKALTETLLSTRFGLPTDKKPLRFSGYYKYQRGAVMTNNGEEIDCEDNGSIYAIVYKNHDDQGNSVVLTGEDVTTSPQLVGMARLTDMQNTDKWTHFDIPFVYTEEIDTELLQNMGYSFAIICSSSENGDRYQGAIGSTLWVDSFAIDIEE